MDKGEGEVEWVLWRFGNGYDMIPLMDKTVLSGRAKAL
jgi:hypothetical protein